MFQKCNNQDYRKCRLLLISFLSLQQQLYCQTCTLVFLKGVWRGIRGMVAPMMRPRDSLGD